MSRVYWDTMLFVYWLEDHPAYGKRMSKILSRMQARGDTLYTSTFTLGEILVGPYKLREDDTAHRIRALFRSPEISLLPFTSETADHYGRIRAQLNVSPADAIHLACAAEADTDLFLTNDAYLVGKIVPGIKFIAGLQTDVF
ncbi:MAG TPA: type II toxin-antitoxin system VapC family toxin [Terriglobales bacterium]|nr:type II toxin-antitoxin system VapC family toxin [Terriglobales bacterium]